MMMRHYVHPECTPTRVSFQTGRLPMHSGQSGLCSPTWGAAFTTDAGEHARRTGQHRGNIARCPRCVRVFAFSVRSGCAIGAVEPRPSPHDCHQAGPARWTAASLTAWAPSRKSSRRCAAGGTACQVITHAWTSITNMCTHPRT